MMIKRELFLAALLPRARQSWREKEIGEGMLFAVGDSSLLVELLSWCRLLTAPLDTTLGMGQKEGLKIVIKATRPVHRTVEGIPMRKEIGTLVVIMLIGARKKEK
jgi:hypothetical protein